MESRTNTLSKHVAAKQIVFHQDHCFVLDAAGQLWWKPASELVWSSGPAWGRVELPPFDA